MNSQSEGFLHFRFIGLVADGAKKSPELIQLLELHTQFSTITPYAQVSNQRKRFYAFVVCCGLEIIMFFDSFMINNLPLKIIVFFDLFLLSPNLRCSISQGL